MSLAAEASCKGDPVEKCSYSPDARRGARGGEYDVGGTCFPSSCAAAAHVSDFASTMPTIAPSYVSYTPTKQPHGRIWLERPRRIGITIFRLRIGFQGLTSRTERLPPGSSGRTGAWRCPLCSCVRWKRSSTASAPWILCARRRGRDARPRGAHGLQCSGAPGRPNRPDESARRTVGPRRTP
jgi:hypothetical protein